MKNVLLIAFYFNQKNEIASKRLRSLAKYLPEYNWKPTVIVPHINGINNKTEFENMDIVETPYEDMIDKYLKYIKKTDNNSNENKIGNKNNEPKPHKNIQKIIHIAGEIFAYPDGMKYWTKPAIETSQKIINEKEMDAIISSSFPITSHIIAKKLNEKYNIPWIADLRDLWNKNPYIHHNKIRNYFENRLEKDTFKNVDALTVTSSRTKKILEEIHPNKNIYTVENGFDKDYYRKFNRIPNKKNKKLNITYAGRLYHGKRDPEILFTSINELIREKKIDKNKLTIDFYGDKSNIYNISEKYNLEDIVNINGYIPHEEVLLKEKESDVLLLLSWNNPKEEIFIPGKIFEYMGLKKPVLSIGYKKGSLKDIISETEIGYHTDNTENCKKYLLRYYNEFINNDKIEYRGNNKIYNYTTEKMAYNFGRILDKITEKQT